MYCPEKTERQNETPSKALASPTDLLGGGFYRDTVLAGFTATATGGAAGAHAAPPPTLLAKYRYVPKWLGPFLNAAWELSKESGLENWRIGLVRAPARKFAEKLGVSVRQVRNYIRTLRKFKHKPVAIRDKSGFQGCLVMQLRFHSDFLPMVNPQNLPPLKNPPYKEIPNKKNKVKPDGYLGDWETLVREKGVDKTPTMAGVRYCLAAVRRWATRCLSSARDKIALLTAAGVVFKELWSLGKRWSVFRGLIERIKSMRWNLEEWWGVGKCVKYLKNWLFFAATCVEGELERRERKNAYSL